jgi:hypothetical protein
MAQEMDNDSWASICMVHRLVVVVVCECHHGSRTKMSNCNNN